MKRIMLALAIATPFFDTVTFNENVGLNAGTPASQNIKGALDTNVHILSKGLENFAGQTAEKIITALPDNLKLAGLIIGGTIVGTVGAVKTVEAGFNYTNKWYTGELAREQAVNKAKRIKAENEVINQMVNLSDTQKRERMRQRDFNEALSDFKWCAARMNLKNPYRSLYRGFANLYTDSNGEPLECKSEFNCVVATAKNPEPFKNRLKDYYYHK
jgi:hypothetical protein